MIYKLILIVLSVIQLFCVPIFGENYCLSNDNNITEQIKNFGSKTAYALARDDFHLNTSGACIPDKVWAFIRHGSRLPDTSTTNILFNLTVIRDQIVNNYYDKTKNIISPDKLCEADVELLKNWEFKLTIAAEQHDYDEFLSEQGWEEMRLLAKAIKKRYPTIFENRFNIENHKFVHAATIRTEDSYRGFVEGLYGINAFHHVIPTPLKSPDILLAPFDECNHWKTHRFSSKRNNTEFGRFINSSIYNEMIFNISHRLGFSENLKRKEIEVMWDMCRYESAWNVDKIGEWCIAFTPMQHKILAYAEDLKYYTLKGYGSPHRNRYLSCAIVQDMLKEMQSNNSLKGIAYFVRSTSLMFFLTSLGAFRDDVDLRADNWKDLLDNRLWRTSIIGPFAANFIAVRYTCNNKIKILFLFNERPLKFDWCPTGFCDWDLIVQQYQKFLTADCPNFYCKK